MKVVGPALLILSAAAVLAGGVYAIDGNGGGQIAADRHQARGNRDLISRYSNPDDSVAPFPENSFSGGRRHGHHSREGVSIGRGLVGVIRSLFVIALITLVVNRVKPVHRAVGLAAVLFFLSPAWAADVPDLVACRTTGRVQVDGALDEDVWKRDPAIPNLVQVEPRSGDQSTEATQVWVAYSADALYIAIRCHDRAARQIVATEMRRDAQLGENDHIAIVLDTYHDHRNAYFFATNATGALVDGRVTENQEPALEWDGIWMVRTLISDDAWTAEFEIPFKTVGFSRNVKDWGFNVSRYLARGRETSRWASPSLDVELNQMVRAGDISGLDELSQGFGVDVRPYGIVGFTRDITRQERVEADGSADRSVLRRHQKGGRRGGDLAKGSPPLDRTNRRTELASPRAGRFQHQPFDVPPGLFFYPLRHPRKLRPVRYRKP